MNAKLPLHRQRLSMPTAVKKGEGCGPASSAPLGLQEIEQGKLLITTPSWQQTRRLNLEVELAKIYCALRPTESGVYIILLTGLKHKQGGIQ